MSTRPFPFVSRATLRRIWERDLIWSLILERANEMRATDRFYDRILTVLYALARRLPTSWALRLLAVCSDNPVWGFQVFGRKVGVTVAVVLFDDLNHRRGAFAALHAALDRKGRQSS